jgi:hypothetical protein
MQRPSAGPTRTINSCTQPIVRLTGDGVKQRAIFATRAMLQIHVTPFWPIVVLHDEEHHRRFSRRYRRPIYGRRAHLSDAYVRVVATDALERRLAAASRIGLPGRISVSVARAWNRREYSAR